MNTFTLSETTLTALEAETARDPSLTIVVSVAASSSNSIELKIVKKWGKNA